MPSTCTSAIVVLFIAVQTFAIPPEGLEGFGILGGTKGKPAKGPTTFYSNIGYTNPSYQSDYSSLQAYGGYGTDSRNYFTYGGSVLVGNKQYDRDAYFARYDWQFWQSSFGFKLMHEDWRYLGAGKNSFGLDYNTTFIFSQNTGVYLSIGANYRWIHYRFNPAPWNPLSFSGEDRQLNLHYCWGLIGPIGSGGFFTVDVNNRDVFSYYNTDHTAVDATLNLGNAPLLFRIAAGIRFTGVSGVAPDLGDVHVHLGFIYASKGGASQRSGSTGKR